MVSSCPTLWQETCNQDIKVLALITVRFFLLPCHTSSAQGQSRVITHAKVWVKDDPWKALISDMPKISWHVHLLLCLESTTHWYLWVCVCASASKGSATMRPCCLRYKTLLLGAPLESHRIYPLIQKHYLKQRIKTVHRLNTVPSKLLHF